MTVYIDPIERAQMAWQCASINDEPVDEATWMKIVVGCIEQAVAAERRRMAQWQPMDTAPSGERVLIYDPRMNTSVVAQQMTAVEDGEKSWVYARKLSGNSKHAVAFVVAAPMHWMPLPEPPA